MKPICQILREVRSLPPAKKRTELLILAAVERKHSIRRRELEAAIKELVERNLGRQQVERRKRRRVIAA